MNQETIVFFFILNDAEDSFENDAEEPNHVWWNKNASKNLKPFFEHIFMTKRKNSEMV